MSQHGWTAHGWTAHGLTAPSWAALEAELALWAEMDRTVPVWWRDDDAVAVTPALERLLDVSARHAAPLTLAVVPAHAELALAERLASEARVTVAQHGYRHRNHEPPEARKGEFGPARPLSERLEDVARGRAELLARFAAASGIFVPPWNRLAPDLPPHLPALGLTTLSMLGEETGAPGRLDVHLDLLTWKGGARFRGEAELLGGIIAGLAARRSGAAKGPLGLMSHHLVMDAESWGFLETLLASLAAHPGARLVSAPDALNLAIEEEAAR